MVTKSKKFNVLPEPYHNNTSFDNLRKKIKTNYMKFLINFFNSLIFNRYNGQRFKLRRIKHEWTKIITSKHMTQIATQTLETVLSNEIRNYRKVVPKSNELIIQKIKPQSPEINHLLQRLFSDFYREYYLEGNIEDIIEMHGPMSSKVVLFEEYYEENTKKESNQYKANLRYVANHLFEFQGKAN